MIEVYHKLFVGAKLDCPIGEIKGMTVLHACKTCHQGKLGYAGKLDVHDPQYLVARSLEDMWLNLIDAPFEPSVALVEAAMGFLSVEHWMKGKPVLIHCDQGTSRAPSLALIYLTQRINWKSYDVFKMKYPAFEPKDGMVQMMKRYGVKGVTDEDEREVVA